MLHKIYQSSYFIILTISLVITLLYYLLILRNDNSLQISEKNLTLLKHKIEQKEKEFKDIKVLIERHVTFQNEYDMAQKIVDDFFQAYIPQISDSTMFFSRIINSPAFLATGVNVVSYKPDEEIISQNEASHQIKNYKLFPLKIKIEGSFAQLLLFISHLTQIDQLITLNDFHISVIKSETTNQIESNVLLTLEGNLFLYGSEQKSKVSDEDAIISANMESSVIAVVEAN